MMRMLMALDIKIIELKNDIHNLELECHSAPVALRVRDTPLVPQAHPVERIVSINERVLPPPNRRGRRDTPVEPDLSDLDEGEIESESQANFIDNFTFDELKQRSDLKHHVKYRKKYNERFNTEAKANAKKQTEILKKKRLAKTQFALNFAQSRIINSESQNFETDDVTDDAVGLDTPLLPIQSGVKNSLTLDNFFKRPIQIHEVSIGVTDFIVDIFNPYELWSNNPMIRSKLLTYAFFKGTLHLNFVMSSTKFMYGSVQVSYQPFPYTNPTLQALTEARATYGATAREVLNAYLSQSPERALLKFGVDNNISMKLPMLLPKQGLKLFNRDGLIIDNSIPFQEFLGLGEIYMSTINRLVIASTELDSLVTIQVYAWMEDVELGPLTATDIVIESESQSTHPVLMAANNMANDEYNDSGPATHVASAISNISQKFANLPVIGKAARATSRVAGIAAKIFNFFGFSKPIQLDSFIYAKSLPFPNDCVLEGKSTAFKLTSDPKQELSLQPLGGESDLDPMAITYITNRQSYFKTFLWSEDSVPLTTDLFVTPVTPLITTHFISEDVTTFQYTALAYAALCFEFWRGTISFKFEVIASSFHKGKLLFVFEPNSAGIDLINAGVTRLNKQYIKVLDIELEKEVTIDCKYVYDKMVCNVTPNESFPGGTIFPELTYEDTVDQRTLIENLYLNGQSIGHLYVRPYTRLITPAENSGFVFINVYVMSNDMEFSVPHDLTQFNSTRIIEPAAARSVIQSESEGVNITQSEATTDKMYLYHFGEKIASFRSLLKRDFQTAQITVESSEAANTIIIPLYPPTRQFNVPQFSSVGEGNSSTVFNNNARNNIFDHLRYAYLFCKGGFRYKVIDFLPAAALRRFWTVTRDFAVDQERYTYDTSVQVLFGTNIQGTVLFDTNTNAGVEFEIPYYSDNLYEPICLPYQQTVDTQEGVFSPYITSAKVNYTATSVTLNTNLISVQAHSAEDFTFFRFQGASFYCRAAA